jgi:NOL1/NOP2/sun family putative RNA methylase
MKLNINYNYRMMNMNLPIDFQNKMKELLQDEYEAFYQSYSHSRSQGLRFNPLKVTQASFESMQPFDLKPIPWVEEGYFYSELDRPGKHPYHDAGLYYIQEPSAMSVVTFLDPQPGERVLDLCAAPGGKTTHIAGRMHQEGFLLTNEIHPQRARILSQNVERFGVKNAVVTNETPERLACFFPSYFDRILVDAPCSGEGMFRKDPNACEEWSLEHVSVCSVRQSKILEHAASMLKGGGRLVYSTCTFSPEENEGVISQFLRTQPEFELVDLEVYEGFSKGRPEWSNMEELKHTTRLWPHLIEGEGHYIAVLEKKSGEETDLDVISPLKRRNMIQDYLDFAKANLKQIVDEQLILFGDQLYQVPEDMIPLEGLKVIRPGLHLGTIKKNRFEPSHALALALNPNEVIYAYPLKDNEIEAYLKGESIFHDGPKGWYLMLVDNYSIGWAKCANNQLKNHYPKGLRWM